MVFSSLEFLFLFFPLVFIGYLLVGERLRNLWLLAASLFFYYAGAKEQILLLLLIILIAYTGGLLEARAASLKLRRLALVVSLGCMLLAMAYFKYFSFLVANINILFHREITVQTIALPIGISFFTFQAISYVVDVYRGEMPLRDPIDMGLYISFFPQLIAGPIVRFHDIRSYLDRKCRKIQWEHVSEGVQRFCAGLCKKVLLANNLGGLVQLVYTVSDISKQSVLYAWLGAIAYTFQIYYDFSGYSDMAIGLGMVFGFKFQENFRFPYAASTIRDFWRRWHISLSGFFRDYVYIPLGGNRCSAGKWIRNILIVWFLTGLWHGSSWNYVIWGMCYGILLLLERFIERSAERRSGQVGEHRNILNGPVISVIRRIITLFFIVLLWVVFKCENMTTLLQYLKTMFGLTSAPLIDTAFKFQFRNFALLLGLSAILSVPTGEWLRSKVRRQKLYDVIYIVLLAVCMISTISYIYMGSYNPFLYFMF